MTHSGLIAVLPAPTARSLRRGREPLPFPLDQEGLGLFAWGRSALHAGLGAVGLAEGDEVLIPAYHHGSEVEAVARRGIGCRFYAGTERLEPDEGELEAMLGPRVRALYLTHYLGFPQRASHWRRWCDERGLLLIEDAAQAWLASEAGRPLGSFGDLAVFCLYKTAPVPDGGAAICRQAAVPASAASAGALRSLAGWAGLGLAQRAGGLGRGAYALRRRRPSAAGNRMQLGVARAPARVTEPILRRLDFARIRRLRRTNYEFLLAALGERAATPFGPAGEGAVPWVMPVRTSDKAGLMAHLQRQGILAADFWSVAHPLLDDDAAAAHADRRATTVGLPVHQELDQGDLERIIDAMRSSEDGRRA